MSTATTAIPAARALPPVLGRLLSGTFWLALRVPLQVVFSLWTTRLILDTIHADAMGAYGFATGFGFFQMLFEFGVSSALQRQISDSWTRGDREGVDRAVACGLNFYTAMAFVQMVALLGLAYWALPHTGFQGESYDLIVKLLWLQIVTAPCYGFSVVVSSVLQAARRYDFIPRLELAITILRNLVLIAGLKCGVDFFYLVVAQTAIQVFLSLGPAVWVMIHDLGQKPRFRGARWADYKILGHISFYMALIQISVVLGDKVDTTILGFAIHEPGPANAMYSVVSKPFLQLRQTGWMLAYMVMPAVASLAAARDSLGLERIKYDGTRMHLTAVLPIGLLGWIYAGPFLTLWIGQGLDCDPEKIAPLMRLFLTAAIPLILSVPVQMAIGVNKIEVIALSALGGALINVPISYYLTTRLGVAGVIWGTVTTTFISNLIVPGVYVFRVLEIDPRTFLKRTLSAPLTGAAALIAATWLVRQAMPITYPGESLRTRAVPLLIHLTLGTVAFISGYLLVPTGRGDFASLWAKLRRR
ncbi:MAG: oligosaccharide flippase family protein [Paludisphaera borealis]|uniref:oligosaccharide flippase family protein n=1 Tax=Paludisphaera borealis TaxID=1387353 RepID=UPI00283B4DB7|nr:oligosaccharide flippase family protein [Paludisphaera borealis]MDR3622881.1 oligosaccharide flippase family protein [Paludisphaera borealis]